MSKNIENCEKSEQASESATDVVTTPSYDLRKFKLTRILQNNTVRKSCALLGTFPNISATDAAIIIFEKNAFRERDVQTAEDETETEVTELPAEKAQTSYFNSGLEVQTDFINNIYGSFQCCLPGSVALNQIKTTVVYPATTKHIEKYSICQKFLINETPALYENVTLPYITASQFTLNWVYNILEHKQETERIVYEDDNKETGFILVPDLKWDGKNVETLYLLAIVHKHDIKSLRDLTAEHLPLLRNMRSKIAAAIEERYGLQAAQLRMYFHYQPSFYHLHVHINPLRNDAPGIWCEKSHILDTVINNLELLADYYQRATLPFVLYDGNKLLELYDQEITIRKRKISAAIEQTEPEQKRLKLCTTEEVKGKILNKNENGNEKDDAAQEAKNAD